MSGRINYSNLSDSLKEKLNSTNMSKGDNIEYVAENSMKTFASDNDGYIDNFYLEGKTLINISALGSIDGTNADGVVRIRFYDKNIIDDSFIHYKRFSGKTFTLYNFTDKPIQYVGRNSSDVWDWSFVVEPYSSNVVVIDDEHCIVGVDFRPVDGWSNADLSIYNERMFMVIEGEQSLNLPYFKGFCSLGTGNESKKHNIEIMTFNKNLLNKEDFVVGSTNSMENEEFIIDSKTNRITHKNPIPLEFLRRYELRYRNVDINAFILQLDENKQVLQRHLWDKYDYIQLLHSNAKYVQIIFSYKDGRNMTIEDFDIINPVLVEECDISNVAMTLNSLPNGAKNTLEKKGDKYIVNYNVEHYTVTGDRHNIEIISSQERTNTIYVRLTGKDFGEWSLGSIISDKFATDVSPHGYEDGITGLWYEDREGLGNVSGEGLRLRINKNRLASQDIEGVKQWLNQHYIEVLYQLQQPKVFEIPLISNRTFEPSTTLMVNTDGCIYPDKIKFEVNDNILNIIEDLYNRLSEVYDKGYEFNSKPKPGGTDINRLAGFNEICHGMNLINTPNNYKGWCTVITNMYKFYNHGYQIFIPWDVNVNIQIRRFNGEWNAWQSAHDKTTYLNNVCYELQQQIYAINGRINNVQTHVLTDPSGHCRNLGACDWNNVKTCGYFMGSNTTNAPENSADWFMVHVMSHNDIWCEQIATAFASTRKRYIRHQTNGSWTAWRSL